jgi:hypothetical protein
MNLYKKNPKIEGVIWIQGQEVDGDTILVGEEYEVFADPMTFPGRPPKLVKVEFSKLSSAKQREIEDMSMEVAKKPPKHLGVVKTDSIRMADGDYKISNKPITKPAKPVVSMKADASKKVAPKVKPENVEYVVILKESFTRDELIDSLPGITESNVKGVLDKFETLEELAKADNVSLKSAGIRSNFFTRVRETAAEMLRNAE